jgi:hypothetical protein
MRGGRKLVGCALMRIALGALRPASTPCGPLKQKRRQTND